MPEIGEIRKAIEIGRNNSHSYIWWACVDCGKTRWVLLRNGKPLNNHCNCYHGIPASGSLHPNWNGGRHIDNGYIWVRLYPDDFFYPMTNVKHYVLEHRLIMAKYLNRCLLPWEIVHHKNGKRGYNCIENLQLISCKGQHNTQLNKRIKELEKRVTLLEAENVLLKEQLAQTTSGGQRRY